MSDSLRNQLLGLGFKPVEPQSSKKTAGSRADNRPPRSRSARSVHAMATPSPWPSQRHDAGIATNPKALASTSRPKGIDLAKAYALRAQKEKQERIEAEQRKQELARQRRQAKARVTQLVQLHVLNRADADIARHFLYGGKIKRIYVTPKQLKALNAGELGVVQLNGRYVLVPSTILAEVATLLPSAVALQVDATSADAPDADSQDNVPDDLVW